ncbi:hypothetical protein [Caballeronia sp. HLA56]
MNLLQVAMRRLRALWWAYLPLLRKEKATGRNANSSGLWPMPQPQHVTGTYCLHYLAILRLK